jgi:hypothetical protein
MLDEEAARPIIVEARPEPIAIEIARTALVVVDMQNDFCSTGGMFDHAGIDIAMVQRAIGPIRMECDTFALERDSRVGLRMVGKGDS